MGTTIGDYVGTTIGIHSPYSLLSTREFCFRAVSAEEVALGCGYGLSCTVVVVVVLVVVVVAW